MMGMRHVLVLMIALMSYATVYGAAMRKTRMEVDCWGSLMELKSCTNEIMNYFVNGEADIGPSCCAAITVITHSCWPSILTSLGFTPQQAYILRGYCDAAPAPSPSFP